LNTNYMTYLGSEWTEMIESTTWKVGGMTETDRDNGAKAVYTAEMITNGSTEYEDEIGLMYVSDYMYAASPTYWSYSGYNSSDATKDYRAAINDNWMYSGVYEWSITRPSGNTVASFHLTSEGRVFNNNVYNYYYGARPVFNLKSNVVWMGGDGSKILPYRVSL